MLHLWRIPPHIVIKAEMPETNDDAEDVSTESAPIEGDNTNLEMALSVGITGVDRKLERIQHERKYLKDRLAKVTKAETAVLQAQRNMGQVSNAMAMADNALRPPMSILARNS